MKRLYQMSLPELINPQGFDCVCGKHHAVKIKYIKTGRGILGCVPEMLNALGAKKPFVLCDLNTYEAAGRQVCAVLENASVPYTLYVIPKNWPKPDEWSIGNILMHFDMSCDLLLAVGSGVLNDCCKEVAYKTGRLNAVVGTAPSMDGFASATASNELDGVKVTIPNQCPQGILLDADIMAQAPMRMLQAGFGDMLAKYIAICEWRISHIVTGEYYCPEIAELVREALRRIMAQREGLKRRDPEAVLAVADGLVLGGLAMAFAGISRPASGLEHYFSHMWEMMALQRHEPYDLHGIQVGVGTRYSAWLYDKLRNLKPDAGRMHAHAAAFDEVKWQAQIREIFGGAAEEILAVEQRVQKNDPVKLQERIERILTHWDEIEQIISEEVPSFEQIEDMMREMDMPMCAADLRLSPMDVKNAYLGARDIRDKYIAASLLWDLGLEQEIADAL